MVYVKTPFRVSFFGGGTDYPPFFEQYGGSILSTTFDKYCYTAVRRCPPFFDFHTQIRYSKVENVRKTEELEHPLVRNCMMYTGVHNLNITYDTDLPARSGIGSSSSFAVGLLQALYALQGKYKSKLQLAEGAIHCERVLCAESGGWQDQIAAAYGGLNRIDFNADGFNVKPVIISSKRKMEFEKHIIMFFTGISRMSDVIATKQTASIRDNTVQLLEMKKLVDEAEKILCSQTDISEFGKLLDYTWRLKRGLTSDISTDFIDEIYKSAKTAGALGGKLMGAGGGGFMVIFAEPEAQSRIRKALDKFVYVPILFENDGSKIIHYVPEEYDYFERSEL